MQTQLPGTSEPYLIRSGTGEHYAVGGQLVSLIARPSDTGGLLEAAIVSGGRGAGVSAHRHPKGHETLMVLEGELDLQLGATRCRLAPGDYASVPPGVAHAYTMTGRITRLIQWSVGGALAAQAAAIGTRTEHATHDEAGTTVVDLASVGASLSDLEPVAGPAPSGVLAPSDRSPADQSPYVLESGAGERLLAADQVFTFLADRRNTRGAFISLVTVGPAGARIPKHFHKQHTETFFCTHGRMTMWAGDAEVLLGPGDFLHVPAGTIHSFRIDAAYTRFIGLLSPGLFEPFFRALCEPFDGHVNPPIPGPFRFDRVIQQLGQLDLVLTEKPSGPPSH